MKAEIRRHIEDLDEIWTRIINVDDHISALDNEIKNYIKDGNFESAYRCEVTKTKLRTRIELLRQRSTVLERLIMTMLLEE